MCTLKTIQEPHPMSKFEYHPLVSSRIPRPTYNTFCRKWWKAREFELQKACHIAKCPSRSSTHSPAAGKWLGPWQPRASQWGLSDALKCYLWHRALTCSSPGLWSIWTLSSRTGRKEHKRQIRKLFSPSSNQRHLYKKRFYENVLSQFNSSLGKKPGKEKNSEKFKTFIERNICLYMPSSTYTFPKVQCPYYQNCDLNPFYFQ